MSKRFGTVLARVEEVFEKKNVLIPTLSALKVNDGIGKYNVFANLPKAGKVKVGDMVSINWFGRRDNKGVPGKVEFAGLMDEPSMPLKKYTMATGIGSCEI